MELALVIITGLVIGSFLNVAIYRLPRKLSVVSPARSYCPKCETQLTAADNIPVLSWLFLGGRCRHCKEPISGQYPFVESLCAAAAVLTYLDFGINPTSIVVFLFAAVLIVVTFIDLEFKIIPDVITIPGMAIGLTMGAVSELFPGLFGFPVTQGTWDTLIGFLVGCGFFYAIAWVYIIVTKKDGLGGGDIKFMGVVGTLFGWQAVPPTIFYGSFLGAIFGIAYMFISGKGRNAEIPFGPWLALGCALYIFTDMPFFRFPL